MLPVSNEPKENASDLQKSDQMAYSEADAQLLAQLFQQSMPNMSHFQPQYDATRAHMQRAVAAQNQKIADFSASLSELQELQARVQAQIDKHDLENEAKKKRITEMRARHQEEMELFNQKISSLENLFQELKK